MPNVGVLNRGRSTDTTIEQAFSAFLKELRTGLPASAVANAETVVDMLRHHLNTCDTVANDGKNFCEHAQTPDLIGHLDRFLRYCVMRELVLSFEQQEFVFFVTYDFCEWLYKGKLLPEEDFQGFQNLREEHMAMWKRACAAAHEIASSLPRRRSRGVSNVIEFGRHDIAQIQDDQVWLEIWSLPTLPADDSVGPITLPKKLAATLQVGWMITCELAKSKSGWQIVEVGNIYPSLPFK